MRITRIDRMERVEDILQEKIENTERELKSLGQMKDAEICRLRIMYLMDLQEMRHSLIVLRRKIDLAYATDGETKREDDEDDETADAGEDAGDYPVAETDQQPGEQERGGGGRTAGGLRHVRPDGAEHPGNDAGETLRARLMGWQREIMDATTAGTWPKLTL